VAAQYLPNVPDFNLNQPRNITNAAAVLIRPETGEIISMLGSVDYWNTNIQGNFNAALRLAAASPPRRLSRSFM
jgi:hypothetical protein